jgi:hypothetical protein
MCLTWHAFTKLVENSITWLTLSFYNLGFELILLIMEQYILTPLVITCQKQPYYVSTTNFDSHSIPAVYRPAYLLVVFYTTHGQTRIFHRNLHDILYNIYDLFS